MHTSLEQRTDPNQVKAVPRSSRFYDVTAAAIIAIMCARIIVTHSVFSQTFDEPTHIAAGLEWLDKGVYEYESAHPPLARVAAAIGPYISGERSAGLPDPTLEGNAILGEGSRYKRNLALARLGELPFAVLSAAGIWFWSRRYFTSVAALFSVLLFSLLPPALAHGGLATTDIAVTAGCVWAIYGFVRLLEEPTWKNAIAFGFWCGFALVCKFSALPFLAVGIVLISGAYLWSVTTRLRPAGMFRLIVLSGVVAVFIVWACYRFSFGPLITENEILTKTAELPQMIVHPGWAHWAATTIPVPAGRFFRGAGQVWLHNQGGHGSYLLGELGREGWWYFFPIVLAIKTPIGFLALAVGGSVGLLLTLKTRAWQLAAPAIVALGMLLVCITSRIDLGVRHILPIYPFLSIGAGHLVAESTRKWRSIRSFFVVGCLAWCVTDSIRAHPDYLAWFNQIAGSHPEHFRIDSDLDWGQDLWRLSERLKGLRVQSVTVSYFGTADLSRFNLPAVHELSCEEPLRGYVAVSITNLYYESITCPSTFHALQKIEARELVGKSIFLYHFPSDPKNGSAITFAPERRSRKAVR